VYSNVSCLTVSNVGTTTSGDATLCVSTSTCGTLLDQGIQSPWTLTWLENFFNKNSQNIIHIEITKNIKNIFTLKYNYQ